MYTLGINAAFHDPAACLVRDGHIIAAAEDERFTHIKHGKRPTPFTAYELPFHAIEYCLREAGITLKDVDHIGYSFDPFLLLGDYSHDAEITLPLEPSAHPVPEQWLGAWDPLFLSSIVNAPRHLAGGIPHHLSARMKGIKFNGPYKWHFVPHHIAHAASAYYPAPFSEAAVMCLDGRGELACTSYGVGKGDQLDIIKEVRLPHSLGLVYEDITRHLGFLHSSDEYKVMALASSGKPVYVKEFQDRIQLGKKGKYTVAPLQLAEWFGPARERGGPLEQKHFDLAHSLQKVLEATVLELTRWLKSEVPSDNLCMAGGVALNCVMNAFLRDYGPFRNIWVQPAAGDSGTALGAALYVDRRERKAAAKSIEKEPGKDAEIYGGGDGVANPSVMHHALLGPEYSNEEIEEFLKWSKLRYRRMENVAEETADLLVQDKVIGWFQGRMEFGPRALGARSILASPIHAEMQARLNEIKDREDFRPVAPAVIEEEAAQWFTNARQSPFMLFVYDVPEDKVDKIPAVRHIDGTARIQTVNRDQHPRYYDLLRAFQKRTGVPVLVNTSFNTRSEPIVCTPRDAVECFWTSPLDALIIGDFCLEKI
ncbi:MAG TPA: carbamoyltransferase C-terminal domain-containing protein [Candidatus Methylacidiphilales bacterium]|nr:carbamoyltransferase C-terminal domain-containing protein [Candidatus Methylacidiphilales bacterium]